MTKLSLRARPEAIAADNTAVYPNPVQGALTVVLAEEAEVTLYSLHADRLALYALPAGVHKLNFSDYPAGVYVLNVRAGEDARAHWIVKQ